MTALKKGFTLIELLIVIAILGVLAVVVLVAINPVQQLARTRDSGRISTVSQLGHAIESYAVTHDGNFPAAGTWNTDLTTVGDIQVFPAQVTNSLTSYCTTNVQQGWCYAVDTATDNFALWSAMEADTNLEINVANCGGAQAHAAYLSETGRVCIGCDTQPTANSDNTWCDN